MEAPDVFLRLRNAIARSGSEEHRALASTLLAQAQAFSEDPETSIENKAVEFGYSSVVGGIEEMNIENGSQNARVIVEDILPFLVNSIIWADHGFPVFNLTYDFFHAMAFTDFGDCESEEVKMPFHVFQVRLPESTLLNGTKSVFVMKIPKVEEDGKTEWGRSVAMIPDNYKGMAFEWRNGIDFKQFINAEVKDYYFLGYEKEEKQEAMSVVRRVLGNTILYINANGGLPPTGSKKLGADVPIEREHTSRPRFRIGRTIKLSPQMRSMLSSSRTGSVWKLSAKFVVRGHWRNQAHGPGKTLRKKMWIEPHWKGPESINEALERTYSVD